MNAKNLALSALEEYNRGKLSESFLKLLLAPVQGIELQNIWTKLPPRLQEMEDIKKKLPCYEHYNLPCDRTHIDGPPPPKYKCARCLL